MVKNKDKNNRQEQGDECPYNKFGNLCRGLIGQKACPKCGARNGYKSYDWQTFNEYKVFWLGFIWGKGKLEKKCLCRICKTEYIGKVEDSKGCPKCKQPCEYKKSTITDRVNTFNKTGTVGHETTHYGDNTSITNPIFGLIAYKEWDEHDEYTCPKCFYVAGKSSSRHHKKRA